MPARRDVVEPAERDKQHGFLTTIPITLASAVFAQVADRGIFASEAVLDVLSNPIVELFRLEVRVGFGTGNLVREGAKFRRKPDVRRFAGEFLEPRIVRRPKAHRARVNVEPNAVSGVAIFDFEFAHLVPS